MGVQAVRLSNTDIDKALDNRDFELLFQPIFDLQSGAFYRVEAFVRWRHRTLGLLPPGAFISFLEAQGRMSELTRYLIDEALETYIAWRGTSGPGLSINLALSDLADETFGDHLNVMLRSKNFPADLITFECPMPPVDQPIDLAARYFSRLAETGARLAIEVRGRANDFLRRIDPFPFHEVKTGGAAILRFARTVRGPGLSAISELLELAGEAEAVTTAVGVEDQASLAALRSLGFAAAQGNHLAKVGDLDGFSAEQINDVRALLGLEGLRPAALTALFGIKGGAAANTDPIVQEARRQNITGALAQAANQQNVTIQDAQNAQGHIAANASPISDAGRADATMLAGSTDAAMRDERALHEPTPDETAPAALSDPALIERLSERIAKQQEEVLKPPEELTSTLAAEEARKLAAIARVKDKPSADGQDDRDNQSDADDVDENLARALQSRLSQAFDHPGLTHGVIDEEAAAAGESFIQAYNEAVLDNELYVDAPGARPASAQSSQQAPKHPIAAQPDAIKDTPHEAQATRQDDNAALTPETPPLNGAANTSETHQNDLFHEGAFDEENMAEDAAPMQAKMRIEHAHGYILPIYRVGFDAESQLPEQGQLEQNQAEKSDAPDHTAPAGGDLYVEDPAALTLDDSLLQEETAAASQPQEHQELNGHAAEEIAPETLSTSDALAASEEASAPNDSSKPNTSLEPEERASEQDAPVKEASVDEASFSETSPDDEAPNIEATNIEASDLETPDAETVEMHSAPDDQEDEEAKAFAAIFDEQADGQTTIPAPPVDDTIFATPPTFSDDDAQDSALDEAPLVAENSPAPTKRRPRKKKNFLTRKYRLWPDHFWPKSWKRAWRRRAAHKAALRAERQRS